MNAILRKLAWKEYQELKWGILGAVAIVLAIPLSYVFRDLSTALMGIMMALVVYAPLAGVFFGMRAAAGERTNRSAGFIASLPVSHALLGAMRLGCSSLAALIPLVILGGLALILIPFTDVSTRNAAVPLASIFAFVVLSTIVSIAIVARAGLGQPSEIRAGVIGFAALVCVYIFSVLVMITVDALVGPLQSDGHYVALTTLICLSLEFLLGITVAVVFVAQYSGALGPFLEPTLKQGLFSNWRFNFLTPSLRALLDKAVREMGMIGFGVLIASVALSFLGGFLGLAHQDGRITWMDMFFGGLPVILFIGGFALAVLIGVGAVIGDVQPGVNTFWRSRPISPHAWYWTKYIVGLVTMLLAVAIPELLIAGSQHSFITETRGVAWWWLVWNCTFSFALTATCLVRQPGYAAILAVGGVSVLYAMLEAVFGSFLSREAQVPMGILAPVFIGAFVGSTVLGWWAAAGDVAAS